jgi:tetrahydromethanopterin S-methyltransferase subunit G
MPYAAPYPPASAREQELAALKIQAEYLEDDMNSIKKRIQEIEKEVK